MTALRMPVQGSHHGGIPVSRKRRRQGCASTQGKPAGDPKQLGGGGMNAGVHHDWGDHLPTLAAERVILRSLDDQDLPALLEEFGDPEVMRYWSSSPLESREAAVALLNEIREGFRTRRLFQWGVAEVGT